MLGGYFGSGVIRYESIPKLFPSQSTFHNESLPHPITPSHRTEVIMRLLFLFLILGVLIAIIVISSLQIGWFYWKRSEAKGESAVFDHSDAKEQIISDLSAENDRLRAELDALRDDLPAKKDQK